MQTDLKIERERIDAICNNCESHEVNDGKHLPLEQCTGWCKSKASPVHVTVGGCMMSCPEDKW